MKPVSSESIQALVTEAVFERGQNYYNEGRVGELALNLPKIEAQVRGSSTYNVVLHHTPKQFEGSCNCPASDGFDFCKHCVAVALAYCFKTQPNIDISEAQNSDKLQTYLQTLTKPELVAELQNVILADDKLYDAWSFRAELAGGSIGAPELRKRITKAIPYKPNGLWRYRDVEIYFTEASTALYALQAPLRSLPSEDQFRLSLYAVERLEKTLKSVDDSGGYRYDCMSLLQEWLNHVFANDRWQDKDKIKCAVQLLTPLEGDFDPLDLRRNQFDAFSKDLKAEVITKLEANWKAMPVPEDHARPSDEASQQFEYLEGILIEYAKQNGNVDHQYALLERGAVTIQKGLSLVEFCIEHQRLDEAESWLDFTSKFREPSTRELFLIESALIDLRFAQGKRDEGITLLWNRFQEQESADALNDILRRCNTDRYIWLEKGIDLLKSNIKGNRTSAKNRQRAEQMALLYAQEGRFDKLVKLHKSMTIRAQTLIQITEAAEQTLPEILTLVHAAADQLFSSTLEAHNQAAVAYLAKQEKAIDPIFDTDYQALLNTLYEQHVKNAKLRLVQTWKATFPQFVN